MKECKQCGKEFEPKNKQQVYCSSQCRQKHVKEYSKVYNDARKEYAKKIRLKREKDKANELKKKVERKNSMAELLRNAEAAGMSYGQYMAVIKMRKMRGEI